MSKEIDGAKTRSNSRATREESEGIGWYPRKRGRGNKRDYYTARTKYWKDKRGDSVSRIRKDQGGAGKREETYKMAEKRTKMRGLSEEERGLDATGGSMDNKPEINQRNRDEGSISRNKEPIETKNGERGGVTRRENDKQTDEKMAEGRDKEKGKAESRRRETDSWEERCDKKEGEARKWAGKQKIEGAPGSSTDKPPMRNKEEYLEEVDGNKEVQDLYSNKRWLLESIQKAEKEIEHIKRQRRRQRYTDAVTISINTRSDGETTLSDRGEKRKLINRAASWTTKKSKQKRKRKSRYGNPKIELTNRFQVLQRKSGPGDESGD